ncbi:MAG: MATE family efflux transporter [Dehalococcoidales bacterium]|jgi:putative MATE family efflux protein
MQEYTTRLGDAPLGRLLMKLSLPGMASTISTSLYNIINTIWVSRIGYEAIAALTVNFPYQILYYAIGGGTGIGIAALVSRRFGENNPDATNHVAGQIFCLSALWGLLFILISVSFPDQIVRILGATPDIVKYSKQYLVITAFGAPLVIFASVIASLLRGSGDAVKPMIIMISSTLINIMLDPFLIFGIGPFPRMGVPGAALSTVIAQAFGALLGLYYLLAGKTTYHVKFAHLRPDISILKDIYRIGAPMVVTQVMESFAFLLFNRVVKSFGSLVIAVVGIIIRISDFAFMPAMGVSNGLLPIVGYNYGAKNYKRLWQAVKLASVGLMILLIVLTIFMVVFAPWIVDVFSNDPELTAKAIPALRIMLSTMLLVGPTMMFITAFQGLSQGPKALFLSLLRQFIFFIPLLLLFRHLFGLTGVWVSMPASDILSFALIFFFIYREYKIRPMDNFIFTK